MRFDRFAPNPHAKGFLAVAYLYGYAALAVLYGAIFKRAETRAWKRQRAADIRWAAAVLAEKRKVEDEIFSRTGSRRMTAEDAERFNRAGEHLKLEDFLEDTRK